MGQLLQECLLQEAAGIEARGMDNEKEKDEADSAVEQLDGYARGTLAMGLQERVCENTCNEMEGLSKLFGQHDTPSNMVQ